MVKTATTAVIRRNGKILIAKRRRDGRWELPGGKVDPGESPADCIRREIKEELNLEVAIVRPLGEVEGIYRDIPMKVYAFLTDWTGGELSKNVHMNACWIEPEHLSEFDIVEEDRVVLEQLKEEGTREKDDS